MIRLRTSRAQQQEEEEEQQQQQREMKGERSESSIVSTTLSRISVSCLLCFIRNERNSEGRNFFFFFLLHLSGVHTAHGRD